MSAGGSGTVGMGGKTGGQNSATWEILLQSVIVPSLCGIGIVGNVLNIFVLTRQRMRRSIRLSDQAVHVGLVGLAVSDMAVCLLTLPRAFLSEYKLLFDANTEPLRLYYQVYSTGLITTFSLISTWLIVATAGMRYVATFYPLQSRLESVRFVHAGCMGVSAGRHGGSLLVSIIYIACSLGNLPSFYLFRVVPVAMLNTNDTAIGNVTIHHAVGNGTTTTAGLISEDAADILPAESLLRFDDAQNHELSTEHPFLLPIATSSSRHAVGPAAHLAVNRAGGDSSFMYIDLGPFQHNTQAGLVFHWVKGALAIFIPGILLTFFNIRLIQALRQSERIRHSSTTSSTSSTSAVGRLTMVVSNSQSGRWVASRNRLNITLVAVIVMLVCLVYPGEFLDFVVHLSPFNSTVTAEEDREAFILTRMFLNTLQLSNFSLNFFLYCTVNVQFRRALTDWFCRRRAPPAARRILIGHRLPADDACRRTFRTTPRVDDVRPPVCVGSGQNCNINMTQLRHGPEQLDLGLQQGKTTSGSHVTTSVCGGRSQHSTGSRNGSRITGSRDSGRL